MITYDRILVPVDGSDGADAAVRHALALAEATGAAVDVVHVVEPGLGESPLDDPDSTSARRERGDALLADVEGAAADRGLEVTTALLAGTPHEAILEHAADRGSHLVVMGRHGAGTVGERLLGGVTEKVLRAGALPVLTAWATDGDDTVADAGELLVPTDGSDCAEVAGEHATTMARVADATVHVVSVADVDAAAGVFDAGGVSEEFVRNVEARCREAVSRMAGDVQRAIDRPVERAVVRGRPGAALREYVEEAGVDLVVMGAHGRSGVSRWMLGSVTERLLRTTDVPLLVVPGEV